MRKSLILAILSCSGAAFADAPGDDMLKPDEINTTGVSANPANDSGLFIGGGLTFGQGRTTEEGATPGLAYTVKFEPGYQMNRGSFSRFELGAELFSGNAVFRTKDDDFGKVTTQIPFGLLIRAGHGYSLGDKLFGIARLGVGPVTAKAKISTDSDDFESDALSGIAMQLGWLMVAPMGGALDATGGISWTHMQFDVDDVESGSVTYPVDRSIILNIPAIEVGLRVRL